MTEADYTAIAARENAAFVFYRVRGGTETRFLPESPKLHFASRDADTLSVGGAPTGFFAPGDAVRVAYLGTTVFLGTLARSGVRHARGTSAAQEAVFEGPWSTMARLVYRQYWKTESSYELSSRLILNQHQSGTAQNLNSELGEILAHAAAACGYQVGTVSVSTQQLPFDECRDITVADAIRRELRFFPRAVVRFDYSTPTPIVSIVRAANASADAAYVQGIPKTERDIEYDEHPITGVDLEIETVGDGYRTISHQRAGNTLAGNPDCLYATLRLAGASGSTVTQSFDSVTEDIPASLNDVAWWRAKHARLQNVAASAITITDGARSGTTDLGVFARISANTAGELDAAGLRYRVEEFTCKATIDDGDTKEEGVLLSVKFLTTNATGTAQSPRRYSWVVSSESTAGETVPSGLAAAILADRAGRLRAERMTVRLGDALPQLGDACDGLFLQQFDVDCDALTAQLKFGSPEFLSPEDMAGLLSGFRNRARPTTAFSRYTGKPEDDNQGKVELGGIPPLEATEWAPGSTAKQTFRAASGSSCGTAVIDSSAIPAGKTIAVKTLTVKGAGENGTDLTFKVLADADVEIPEGGATLDKEFQLSGVKVADIAASANINVTQKTITGDTASGIVVTEANGVITISFNGGAGGTTGYTGTRYTLKESRYDAEAHKLQMKRYTETWTDGVMTDSVEGSWEDFSAGALAVQETV